MTLSHEPLFAGFSPHSSPELGSMLYDDDLKEMFDFDDKPKKSNGRKGSGPGAADKRATHNAIERARRESLNGRFMTLAEALPTMANVKRPSKSIIVNKALDFVFDAQVKEHALIKENNDLRQQVDQLRVRLGMAPLPPPAPLIVKRRKSSSNGSTSSAASSPAPPPSPPSAASIFAAPHPQPHLYLSASSASPSTTNTTDSTTSPSSTDPSSSVDSHHDLQQQQQQQHGRLLSLPPTLPPTTSSTGGLLTPTPFQPFTPFGYLNVNQQSLLAQQHSLLLAAHLQQQQQQQQQQVQQHQQQQHQVQHQQQQQQHQQHTMGLDPFMNCGWQGQVYNPLEPYPFMA